MICFRILVHTMGMIGIFVAGVLSVAPRAAAQQEKVLHSFGASQTDGTVPYAGVISDAAGNLYGTTNGGGNGFGTVFEMVRSAGGHWTEKILYSFGVSGSGDGNFPRAGVVFDRAGNLYGTTVNGGSGNPPFGCGIVFELSPTRNGGWSEKVLHNFQTDPRDGSFPNAGLIVDTKGNLYGVTNIGGTFNFGTVFELTPTANGHWDEKILHSFGSSGDGQTPVASLIFDGAGNLYGTTSLGGFFGLGTVFELTPASDGNWDEKVIHTFGGTNDGGFPLGSLIFDPQGNLYGTTNYGLGPHGVGTAFRLMPEANGAWTEQILHNFNNGGVDGVGPSAGLLRDASGNLYGATEAGGTLNVGIVFELSPTKSGPWTETILHNFNVKDGFDSIAVPIFDGAGNLYGTTEVGGANGLGEVFELIPAETAAE